MPRSFTMTIRRVMLMTVAVTMGRPSIDRRWRGGRTVGIRRYPDGLDDPTITLAAIRLDLHQCVIQPSRLSDPRIHLPAAASRSGDGVMLNVGDGDADGKS